MSENQDIAEILCKSVTIKFKQGVGLNDQLVSTNEVPDTSYLVVRRSEDELFVAYAKENKEEVNVYQYPTRDYLKIIIWNFSNVAEYCCAGLRK